MHPMPHHPNFQWLHSSSSHIIYRNLLQTAHLIFRNFCYIKFRNLGIRKKLNFWKSEIPELQPLLIQLTLRGFSGVARIWRLGANMASAKRERIWGSGGETPQWSPGPRGKAPGHRVQGALPPEAESSSMFLKGSFR
jgi:hypothetical protein